MAGSAEEAAGSEVTVGKSTSRRHSSCRRGEKKEREAQIVPQQHACKSQSSQTQTLLPSQSLKNDIWNESLCKSDTAAAKA